MKWLIDPLPVNVRVIVSVNVETCPQAWRYVVFLRCSKVAWVRIIFLNYSYSLKSKQPDLSRSGNIIG